MTNSILTEVSEQIKRDSLAYREAREKIIGEETAQVEPKRQPIIPPTMMKLARMMEMPKTFLNYQGKSLGEVSVYELKDIVEELLKALSHIQEEISVLEKNKIRTGLDIIRWGGSTEKLFNSIEFFPEAGKNLKKKEISIKIMIAWVQELVEMSLANNERKKG